MNPSQQPGWQYWPTVYAQKALRAVRQNPWPAIGAALLILTLILAQFFPSLQEALLP